jgi:hypothetical protein
MTRTKLLLIVFLGVALGGGIVFEAMKSPDQRAQDERAMKDGTAPFACLRAFKRTAHDPDSVSQAERPPQLRTRGNGTATLEMEVRAKNKLGALVLTRARCELKDAGGQWDVTAVKEVMN